MKLFKKIGYLCLGAIQSLYKLLKKDIFVKERAKRISASRGDRRLDNLEVLGNKELGEVFSYLDKEAKSRREIDYFTFEEEFNKLIKKLKIQRHIDLDLTYYHFDYVSKIKTLVFKVKNALIPNKHGLSLGVNDRGDDTYFSLESLGGCSGIDIVFENIVYDDEHVPADFVFDFRPGYNDTFVENSLTIKNCDLVSVSIDASRFKKVSIIKSSGISQIKTSSLTKQIRIVDSVVGDLELTEGLEHLSIKNSEIGEIKEIWLLTGSKQFNFLSFDSRSLILGDAYSTYKNLRSLANTLGDKIQSFILYAKELDAYGKTEEADFDSKILININKWINRNGMSFLQPLGWVVLLNFLFVFLIFNIEISSGNTLDIGYLWNSISYLPTEAVVKDNFLNVSLGIDGLRRIILTILIYLIISSALRFKFKS